MSNILLLLLIVAVVKFVFFGIVLYYVFRPEWRKAGQRKPAPTTPVCIYCESRWTHAVDEGQTRWEEDELVLVTTYTCEHCSLPFWLVERVPMGSVKR